MMRCATLRSRGKHADHLSCFVKIYLGLREVEIHGTLTGSLLGKDLAEFLHHIKHGDKIGVTAHLSRIALNQDFCHRGVRHPFPAPYHSLDKPPADDAAAPVDFHQRGQNEPVFAGLQAADSAGKLGRKHGNCTVREIHGSAALVCLPIQCRVLPNIMRYVRNVYAKPIVPRGELFQRNGIVEIPRRFAIDCHQWFVTEVLPSRKLGLGHMVWALRGFGERFGAEFHRQSEFVLDNAVLDARVVGVAKDLLNAPLGCLIAARRNGQRDDHDLAVFGTLARVERYADVMQDAHIDGDDERKTRVLVITTHDGRMPAFKHPHDGAFQALDRLRRACPPPPRVSKHPALLQSDFDEDAVSMNGTLHVSGRNEDILLVHRAVVGNQEPVSIAVAGQGARNQTLCRGNRVPAAFDPLDDLLRIEFVQIVLKASAVIAVDVDRAHHIPKSKALRLQRTYEPDDLVLLRFSEHKVTMRDSCDSTKLFVQGPKSKVRSQPSVPLPLHFGPWTLRLVAYQFLQRPQDRLPVGSGPVDLSAGGQRLKLVWVWRRRVIFRKMYIKLVSEIPSLEGP